MTKQKDDFVHLHVHSDMSQLDGCGKIKDYVQKAKQQGSPAIAFTEHGTMRGFFQSWKKCHEQNIKSIQGIEFYCCDDMYKKGLTDFEKEELGKNKSQKEKKEAIREYEDKNGLRQRTHLTVWAKNDEGLKNLFKLSSKAYLEGFYFKPRCDLNELINHKEGLIVASGCMNSVINNPIIKGQTRKALENADKLYEAFGKDFYLEIQNHPIEEQKLANQFALELKNRYNNIGLLATQDAHYINAEDHIHHEVLLCIGTRDYMSNPAGDEKGQRFNFSCAGFDLKSRQEMFDTFRQNHDYINASLLKESLDNTLEIAEKCNTNIKEDYLAAILPKFNIPNDYNNEFEYLKALSFKGWIWRDIEHRAEQNAKRKGDCKDSWVKKYKERLVYELNLIKKKRFVSYFLIVHDIYQWARENNILTGPGRGSSGASLICYLLGITGLDPLEHGLIFSRFMSEDRIDLPDIDMDFGDRQAIINYIKNKYGENRVAQISNLGTLRGKQVTKDVARAFGVPFEESNKLTSIMIERNSGDDRVDKTVEDSFNQFDACIKFDKKYPDVKKHASYLEGMTKSLGIHAGGVVITPTDLTDFVPIEKRKYDGEDIRVTSDDYRDIAALGLVKFDILGLNTLTILDDCLKLIKENKSENVDLENLDLYDDEILKGFTENDFSGVFQFDTNSAYDLAGPVKFTSFDDIPAVNALNRPGPMQSGLSKKWVKRKGQKRKTKDKDTHPIIEEITKDTLGIITYQEHITKILVQLAGFNSGTADSVRKKIAKSEGTEALEKLRGDFVSGCLEKNDDITKELANKIFDKIKQFGSYSFVMTHSYEYGVIAYWCMYLKKRYPLEFYCALLKNQSKDSEIQKIFKDAKKAGIKFLPCEISVSKETFAIDPNLENTIRLGLSTIKGVGEVALRNIIQNQPYVNFIDFITRINRRKCNKKVVNNLILAGAFDKLFSNVRFVIENFEFLWSNIEDKKLINNFLKLSEKKEKYSKSERQLAANKVNPMAFGKHPMSAYKDLIKENIKIDIKSLGDEDFFEQDHSCFIAGIIVDSKYGQIGDYHTGDLPTKEEQKLKFWGARLARINVEDVSGSNVRIKYDHDVFENARPVIDKGSGTAVIAHVNVNSKYKNLNSDFILSLDDLFDKIKEQKELNIFEKMVTGQHPAMKLNKKERVTNNKFLEKKSGVCCGVVTRIRKHYDKNKNQMAFVGLCGVGNSIEVVCFSSVWQFYKNKFSVGDLIEIKLEGKKNRGSYSYFYNGAGMNILKRAKQIE